MKLISKCLVTLLSVTTILMFTACSTASEPHVHSFGSYSFDAAYSSGDTGTMTRTCSACNQKDTITVKVLSVSAFTSQLSSVTTITADPGTPGVSVTGTTANVYKVALTGDFSASEKFPLSLVNADLSGLITDKVTSFKFLFFNCSDLESITFGNWNTSNVTSCYGMFYGCKKIESLDLSFMNTQKVIDMSSMFQSCSKLKNLNISNFDTTNVTSMKQMFTSNLNLKVLDLSSFNTSKVTDMSSMFAGNNNLITIYANAFDLSALVDDSSMFYNCINIRGAVTYNQSNPNKDCANMANTTNGYFTKPQ